MSKYHIKIYLGWGGRQGRDREPWIQGGRKDRMERREVGGRASVRKTYLELSLSLSLYIYI
jgi:hypothetical protein